MNELFRNSLNLAAVATLVFGSAMSTERAEASAEGTRVRARAAEESQASQSQSKKLGDKKRTSRKASSRSRRSTQNRTQQGSKLGTDFSFDAAAVRGKYQYADEGVVTVEDEKTLVDLLGMRTHFKDRLGDETNRQ